MKGAGASRRPLFMSPRIRAREPRPGAASRRREAVVLYLVPLVLLGTAGAIRLARGREDEALLIVFVVSALAVAGAIAAWLKRWQAGLCVAWVAWVLPEKARPTRLQSEPA